MLILRSFFESVFLFVKSLAVKVTKQMYRSSSVIVTGVMVVSVISFSANGFGGSGKNAMAAPIIEENGEDETETQEELADALGVTRQTIISLENGKYNASLQLAHKIAVYFHMNIEEIFLFEEE